VEQYINRIQEEQFEWSKANFGPQDPMLPLLGVVEEVGELCHAVLKRKQGIRMNEDHLAMEKDAIGDIVIYLMDYCNRRGFNLLNLVSRAWDEVRQRDWSPYQREDGSWTYIAPGQGRLFDE
jgi:NTP pyrophosphatase (non-canonical NTP hydrolase)